MSNRRKCLLLTRMVAKHFGIPTKTIYSGSRVRSVARARFVAMALARKFLDMSYPELGSFYGGRDHSTCIYAVQAAHRKLEPHIEVLAPLVRKALEGK